MTSHLLGNIRIILLVYFFLNTLQCMLLGITAACYAYHDHHHITEELDPALNWFSTFY